MRAHQSSFFNLPTDLVTQVLSFCDALSLCEVAACKSSLFESDSHPFVRVYLEIAILEKYILRLLFFMLGQKRSATEVMGEEHSIRRRPPPVVAGRRGEHSLLLGMLPPDLIKKVVGFCGLKTTATVSQCSKELYQIAQEMSPLVSFVRQHGWRFAATSDGRLWTRMHTGVWRCSEKTGNISLLEDFLRSNWVAVQHPLLEHLKSSRRKSSLLRSLLTRVQRDCARADNWHQQAVQSTRGWLLFSNGAYDGMAGTLVGLDKLPRELIFFSRVNAPYPARTEATLQAAAEMEQRLFKDRFVEGSEEQCQRLIDLYAAALFGLPAKQLTFVYGDVDSGKTTCHNAISDAFSGVVGFFRPDLLWKRPGKRYLKELQSCRLVLQHHNVLWGYPVSRPARGDVVAALVEALPCSGLFVNTDTMPVVSPDIACSVVKTSTRFVHPQNFCASNPHHRLKGFNNQRPVLTDGLQLLLCERFSAMQKGMLPQ